MGLTWRHQLRRRWSVLRSVRAIDGSVRAAEWLAERRHATPSPRMVVELVVAMVIVAALDIAFGGDVSTGLLWVPLLVVTVAIRYRAATVLCTGAAVTTGMVADTLDGDGFGLVLADGLLRLVGFTMVAVLASWSVLSATELTRRSRTDSSTGLLNRAGFLAAVARERERALRNDSTLSLVYFDLDGLKEANDRYGHHFGDVLLDHFARHLDGSRRILDVPARLGGDEFALLLPSTDAAGVDRVLRRLYCSMARDDWCLPASAGGVTWLHPPTADVMLREADRLMYEAKQRGGREWLTVVMDPAEDESDHGHDETDDGGETGDHEGRDPGRHRPSRPGQEEGEEGVRSGGAVHEWSVRR